MALGQLKEWKELQSLGKHSNGDMGVSLCRGPHMPLGAVGWGGLISSLLSHPASLFTILFSSGMSLYEGQCFKAQKLFGFMLLVQTSAAR